MSDPTHWSTQVPASVDAGEGLQSLYATTSADEQQSKRPRTDDGYDVAAQQVQMNAMGNTMPSNGAYASSVHPRSDTQNVQPQQAANYANPTMYQQSYWQNNASVGQQVQQPQLMQMQFMQAAYPQMQQASRLQPYNTASASYPMQQNTMWKSNTAQSAAKQEDVLQMQAQTQALAPKVQNTATGKRPAVTATKPEEPKTCLLCEKSDADVQLCAGGCGLAFHPACIGPETLTSTQLGKLCGSCAIMQQTRSSDNEDEDMQKADKSFSRFGHLASLRLHEIGEMAGYPLKPFASKFIEPYLQRWMREKLSEADKMQLNVRDVFTYMIGLYSLQETSIAHGLKDKIEHVVQEKQFSVNDFLGWHPGLEGPQVRCSALCTVCGIRNSPELNTCGKCRRPLAFPSTFTKYASGLLASYWGERVGISIGASLQDVFSHTSSVRSLYKGLQPVDPAGHPWEAFSDQMRMIFGLLDVASDFGMLQLRPELFQPEVQLIFNGAIVSQIMQQLEYELLGKYLQCMKLFGSAMEERAAQVIQTIEHFLINGQQPNGCWCRPSGNTVDQYKTTVTCAKGLVRPRFKGVGPVSADIQRLLEKWSKTKTNDSGKEVDRLANGVKLKSGKQGAKKSMKRLESLYKTQVTPKSDENALEQLAKQRLQAIFPVKKEYMTDKSEEKEEDDSNAAEGSAESTTAETTPTEGDQDPFMSLSLNGELSIFDGLKFEDGDIIELDENADHDGDTIDVKEEFDETDADADVEVESTSAADQDTLAQDVVDDDNDEDQQETAGDSKVETETKDGEPTSDMAADM